MGNLAFINWNFQPCLIFQFWHHDSWNDDMTHLKRMSSIKWVFNFDDYNRILKLLFGRHLATYDFENRLSLGMSQVIHDWREAIKGSKELKFSENAFQPSLNSCLICMTIENFGFQNNNHVFLVQNLFKKLENGHV